ncbi:hypothetical protein PRUPE_8G058600 [Prunus persica]|uniref:Uncharacterized protein n=1 Tax=Prunus persica TaxID=3760 RepID=A0A251MTU7_PRUPE|nr:hypothetical protein PRUPE_8G058600 [Prunus persica]
MSSATAPIDPPPMMVDHLYSLYGRLNKGKPPSLVKNSCENLIIREEPTPETTPVVDPSSVSRCYIEKGMFSAVPLIVLYIFFMCHY